MALKDFLRKLPISRGVLVTLAIASVAISLVASLRSSQWHWFQRSGAVVVSAGALLSTRRLVRLGVAALYRAETDLDGGGAAPTKEDEEAMRQWYLDLSAMRLGFYLLAVGTAIWAYGDVLGALL